MHLIKLSIFIGIGLAILLMANSGNPPNGHTGAPGEGACTNCHNPGSSGNISGNVQITGLPSNILPNTQYNINVRVNNTSSPLTLAIRGGFQLVALNGTNQNVGTLSDPDASSIISGSGRRYWEHNPSQFFSGGGNVNYTAKWTSPNSAAGNTVTMYASSILSNGSGNNSGDLMVQDFTSGTMPPPAPPSASITQKKDPSCFGGMDGTMTVTASGGSGSYSYLWSNGATTAMAINLSAGSYSVTVTDGNSNTASASSSLTQPTQVGIQLNAKTDVTCPKGSNGTIRITANGGTSPHTYFWSNNSTQNSLVNLTDGTYTVTVTDRNNCTATNSYSIIAPDTFNIQTDILKHPNCPIADSTGQIRLKVFGGTPGYKYKWNTSDTSIQITKKPIGTYTVTVTDIRLCSAIKVFQLKANDTISPVIQTKSVVLNLNDSGYVVIKNSDIIQSLSDNCDMMPSVRLSADTLRCNRLGLNKIFVEANDLSGNIKKDSAIVTIVDLLKPAISCPDTVRAYTCNYIIPLLTVTDNCSIKELTLLDTIQIGDTLSYGQYNVKYRALDNSDNESICNVRLIIDESVTYEIDSLIVQPCVEDGLEAWIKLHAVFDSNYLINGVDTVLFFKGDTIIYYKTLTRKLHVGIFDSLECFFQTIDALTFPGTKLNLNSLSKRDATTSTSKDGSLEIEIKGGLPPYLYIWLNEQLQVIGNAPTINNLGVGKYSVRVTDSLGCSKLFEPFEIKNLTAIQKLTKNNLKIYPNPVSQNLFIELGQNDNYTIQIYDLNKRLVSQVQTNSDLCQFELDQFANGIYEVIVISKEFIQRKRIVVQK
ncbi:MAG: T9SS type A sorting domain-containing protein [Bacteroidota bacterium]|nr:T9SS type A sorting domain-containing protein [Bacteroidota bacterium]